MVQKVYSKMHLVSCTSAHRDVTDSVNHGMVKNIKTWITWERNIIFLRNKKILNLLFRWHILSSYRFVAEVTFKLRYTSWWMSWTSSVESEAQSAYSASEFRSITEISRRYSSFYFTFILAVTRGHICSDHDRIFLSSSNI